LISRRSARTLRLKREPSHDITHSIVNQRRFSPLFRGRRNLVAPTCSSSGGAHHFHSEISPSGFVERTPRTIVLVVVRPVEVVIEIDEIVLLVIEIVVEVVIVVELEVVVLVVQVLVVEVLVIEIVGVGVARRQRQRVDCAQRA